MTLPNNIFEKLKWFVDPIPDWIIKDPGKWQEVVQVAVDFHVKEIDLQIQTLALEKERLQKMVGMIGR